MRTERLQAFSCHIECSEAQKHDDRRVLQTAYRGMGGF